MLSCHISLLSLFYFRLRLGDVGESIWIEASHAMMQWPKLFIMWLTFTKIIHKLIMSMQTLPKISRHALCSHVYLWSAFQVWTDVFHFFLGFMHVHCPTKLHFFVRKRLIHLVLNLFVFNEFKFYTKWI